LTTLLIANPTCLSYSLLYPPAVADLSNVTNRHSQAKCPCARSVDGGDAFQLHFGRQQSADFVLSWSVMTFISQTAPASAAPSSSPRSRAISSQYRAISTSLAESPWGRCVVHLTKTLLKTCRLSQHGACCTLDERQVGIAEGNGRWDGR